MDDSESATRRSRSGGLKHLFAQMLLRSSCTTTAVVAADLIQLPRERHCRCCPHGGNPRRHLAAPVVQVSVHCGTRHSFRTVEQLPPPPPHEEKTAAVTRTRKKQKKNNKMKKMVQKKERRVTENGDIYETGEREGRKCPPASPSSPPGSFHSELIGSCASFDRGVELDLVSSSEEEKEDRGRRRTRTTKTASLFSPEHIGSRWTKKKSESEAGMLQMKTETAAGGVAVVKNSSDPYADFRSSMAEMMAERRMSSAREMQSLLNWYLSLNSPLHHAVILEAFVDLWEAISG